MSRKTLTIDSEREVTVDHLPSGGFVIGLEDPHSVALVEVPPEQVEAFHKLLEPEDG